MILSRHIKPPCRRTASTFNIIPKNGHLPDGLLSQLNKETVPVSLRLMHTNYKPVHARVYTVPRSEEQQLQPRKDVVIFVNI
jgi:hypothetical protein